jgi:hypothetical protein
LFAAELDIDCGVVRKKLEVDYALKIPSLPFLAAGHFFGSGSGKSPRLSH